MTNPDPSSLRVSVAVVTYNGERFVREQLETILGQVPAPDEVVIGDDGSEDGTLAAVRDVISSTHDIPIRVLAGGHVGLRLNVQRTLEACAGDVIVLADQDDIWMPGKIEAVREAFSRTETMLWFSDAEIVDEDGHARGQRLWSTVALPASEIAAIEQGRALRRMLHGQTVTGATMAFHAQVRELALPLPRELDGDEHLYLHDGWIAVLASLMGHVVTDSRALTHYRRHPDQVTAQQVQRRENRPTPGSANRSPLVMYRARVFLVRQRVRDKSAGARCDSTQLRTLAELDDFLAVRTMPPSFRRIIAIVQQLCAGRYSAYARGLRTAAADVFGARRMLS